MATVSLKSMYQTIIFTPVIDEGGKRNMDGRRKEGRKERKMLVLLVKMVEDSLSENRLNNIDPFTFDSIYIKCSW